MIIHNLAISLHQLYNTTLRITCYIIIIIIIIIIIVIIIIIIIVIF